MSGKKEDSDKFYLNLLGSLIFAIGLVIFIVNIVVSYGFIPLIEIFTGEINVISNITIAVGIILIIWAKIK